MSTNKTWSSIGEEIRGAVEDALRTGNFQDLGDVVTDTVKDVSSKVGQVVSDGLGGTYNHDQQHRERAAGNRTEQWANATRERKRAMEEASRARQEQSFAAAKLKAPFVKIGRVSGTLFKVFGGIGTGVMSILSLVFLLLAIFGVPAMQVPAVIFLLFLVFFIGMIRVGCGQTSRLKRAQKYLELAGHNHYINLEDLALHTRNTVKFVLKDVKRMLSRGFFPEGHLDMQESCLMLDDKIYKEYLSLENQRRVQEQEQKQQEKERRRQEKKAGKKSGGSKDETQTQQEAFDAAGPEADGGELDEMIAEGQSCIKRLREMNDNIPGEEISAKLFRLENILREIFTGLKEHPEQAPQMRKFMNYYLPTTLKLVEAYEDFESVSSQGEEIREAKAEIEKTLDSINSAFEELLNRMFRDTAYDVTTDAQVLQSMLAREGLTRQRELEFEKVPR